MPPVNPAIRLTALVLGVAIALSALGGAGAALAPLLGSGDQRPAWILFGFELAILVAGVIAVLFGRGRYSEAPGMALACIAGTVLVGSALGWQAALGQAAGISLMPFLIARALASLVLGFAAAACVLSRARGGKAWRSAILGAALGIPVVAAAGAALHPAGRRVIDGAMGSSAGVQAAIGVGAFLLLASLLSASVHLVVRAFEMGRTDDADAADPAPGPK